MTDSDDIARRLRAAVDQTPPRDEDVDAIAALARRRRTVRWAASAGVTAIVAVLAVAAATTLAQRQREPDRIDLAGTPASPDTSPTASATPTGSRDLPPAPLDARWAAFSASTGERVFVWGGYAWAGGEGPRSDGAVYDGTAWSQLPPGPLPALMRDGGAAAWTGEELWIVGGAGGDDGRTPSRAAAAYRPETEAWRELPSVPEPVAGGAWAGDRLVVIAAATGGDRPVYALGAGDDRWRELDALPPVDPAAADNSDLHVVASDDHVVAAGMGAAFILDGGGSSWRPLPAPDGSDPLAVVRGAVAEEDAVVVLLSDATYRYDLAGDTWSRVADGLQPDPPQPVPLVRTGDALVAVDVVNGRMHSLSDGAWVALAELGEPRVDATVEVAGDRIVVWGGMGSEQGASEGLMLDP